MRVIFLGVGLLLYSGCTHLKQDVKQKKAFSCDEKAKPKTLLEIEQQYRCTSK